MSPELISFAHHVGTALTVGGAVGFLIVHFWPRGSSPGAQRGCAHCPANVTVSGPTHRVANQGDDRATPGRPVRSARLRILD